jgi:hypothetical protein
MTSPWHHHLHAWWMDLLRNVRGWLGISCSNFSHAFALHHRCKETGTDGGFRWWLQCSGDDGELGETGTSKLVAKMWRWRRWGASGRASPGDYGHRWSTCTSCCQKQTAALQGTGQATLRRWTEAAKVDRHGDAEVPAAELFLVVAALAGGLGRRSTCVNTHMHVVHPRGIKIGAWGTLRGSEKERRLGTR